MREFKFRAWDKADNRWAFKGDTLMYLMQANNSGLHLGALEIMQSTGLKDSKGVEIYEGDIVSDNGELCEVVWYKAGWWLKNNGELFPYSYMEEVEVIGNIMENPELLEVNNV